MNLRALGRQKDVAFMRSKVYLPRSKFNFCLTPKGSALKPSVLRLILAVVCLGATTSTTLAAGKAAITENEAHEIAVEAYIYLYPFIISVTADVTGK